MPTPRAGLGDLPAALLPAPCDGGDGAPGRRRDPGAAGATWEGRARLRRGPAARRGVRDELRSLEGARSTSFRWLSNPRRDVRDPHAVGERGRRGRTLERGLGRGRHRMRARGRAGTLQCGRGRPRTPHMPNPRGARTSSSAFQPRATSIADGGRPRTAARRTREVRGRPRPHSGPGAKPQCGPGGPRTLTTPNPGGARTSSNRLRFASAIPDTRASRLWSAVSDGGRHRLRRRTRRARRTGAGGAAGRGSPGGSLVAPGSAPACGPRIELDGIRGRFIRNILLKKGLFRVSASVCGGCRAAVVRSAAQGSGVHGAAIGPCRRPAAATTTKRSADDGSC